MTKYRVSVVLEAYSAAEAVAVFVTHANGEYRSEFLSLEVDEWD